MGGVIVVDVGRSRSTCLGRDAYIHDHCLGCHHDYLLFYQLPNSNLFTHRMMPTWEMSLGNTMAPGSIHLYIRKRNCYLAAFIYVTPKMRSYPYFGTRASTGIEAHLIVLQEWISLQVHVKKRWVYGIGLHSPQATPKSHQYDIE